MDKLTIETTQNVSIEYEIGSLGDRILATIIDWLIIFGYYVAILILFRILSDTGGFGNSFFILVLIIVLPAFLYPLLCETFMNGQSFGKRARKIKVIRLDGRQPTFGNYLLRWLIGLVEVNFYGIIALITIVFNGKGQRLGDIAAGTAVIKMKARESISNTAFENVDDGYVPAFPQVANLSDEDIAIVRQVLKIDDPESYYAIKSKLVDKIKETLHIESNMDHEVFLQTVLKDFNKIHGRL